MEHVRTSQPVWTVLGWFSVRSRTHTVDEGNPLMVGADEHGALSSQLASTLNGHHRKQNLILSKENQQTKNIFNRLKILELCV